MIPVILFSAPSGFGKSFFISSLIPYLSERGIRVGYVKHHHGRIYSPEKKTKDTGKMLRAGVERSLLIADDVIVIEEPRVNNDNILSLYVETYFNNCDIVIVEGFKEDKIFPKVILLRGKELAVRSWYDRVGDEENVIAMISDQDWPVPYPRFAFSEMREFSQFLIDYFLLAGKKK